MTDPTPPADYSDLRALFVNCTLTRSPGESHTARLLGAVAALLRQQGVAVEQLRAIDHRIATGIQHDMADGGGWGEDAWPDIFERVMAADILVLGTPIWLGEKSSVCTRFIERLYGSGSRYNDRGQFPYYGKVGGWVVTGNEDGVKHVGMGMAYSLGHLGFTVPPNPDTGWIGEIGPGRSFGDEGEVGLDNPFTHRNVSLMAWNLLHFARMLRDAGGVPQHGTGMQQWLEEGERYGTPELRRLVELGAGRVEGGH